MQFAKTQTKTIDPAVSTAPAYSSGDAVGTVMDVSVGTPLGTGLVKSLTVIDIDNQKAPLTVLLFREQPAGTFTDNAALPLSAADAKLLVAKIDVAAGDYVTINNRAVAQIAVSLAFTANRDRTLYMAVLTTGTPTYTTTASLRLLLGLLLDGK